MLDEYKTVLVTGGAGFIGRHLVNALLDLGKEVVVLDDLSTAAPKVNPRRVRLIHADIREPKGIAEAANGADLIFHLAANSNGTISVENIRLDFETNAMGTFNILEAALRAGTKRVLYVSSASVYGVPLQFPMDEAHPTRPFVPHGASKLAGEMCSLSFSRAYGLPVVIARPFCVYGPGENPGWALVEVSRYLRWHLNNMPIHVVGDVKRKTRDFVHVSDVVQGLMLTADRGDPGEVYNLGSGEEVSMRQLTDAIGDITGRVASVNEISSVTEDTYRLVSDISKISSIGYAPRMSLADGLTSLVADLGDAPELPSGATIFFKGQKAERLADS